MRPATKLIRTQLASGATAAFEEDETDIFSSDLLHGNEAGKSMDVDISEQVESVDDDVATETVGENENVEVSEGDL